MKKNPYIAYNCIRVTPFGVVVSNGAQTDVIADRLQTGVAPDLALQSVLEEMGYEKDEFNTPRIAGILTEMVGYIGIVRNDALESSMFDLEDGICRYICTYERNRIDGQNHPFAAESAVEAAQYIYERGVFKELEKPICSAAWMGNFAVHNPQE
jgi:IMP cyclohydrolase